MLLSTVMKMCHGILREMYMYIQLMKQIKFMCELQICALVYALLCSAQLLCCYDHDKKRV